MLHTHEAVLDKESAKFGAMVHSKMKIMKADGTLLIDALT